MDLKKFSFWPSLVTWCLGGSILFSAVAGCSKGKTDIPDITDEPLTASVTMKDLPETVPAYGIAASGAFEVNLEAKDASRVRVGQRAFVTPEGSSDPLECRVSGVIPNVNLATGQAVAWLRPAGGPGFPAGEFVSAAIVVGMRYKALTVPQDAVYVRDGKPQVLLKRANKDGTAAYDPTPVETGVATDTDVEIVSGLKAGEEVATQAGIGYLYPDFKANADD